MSIKILLFVGIIGAAACDDFARSVAPTAGEPSPAVVSAEEMAALVAAVEDSRLRILPVLGDAVAAGELGGALERLAKGLAAREPGALGALMLRARVGLDRFGSPDRPLVAADAADVDAIRLAVERAAALAFPHASGE